LHSVYWPVQFLFLLERRFEDSSSWGVIVGAAGGASTLLFLIIVFAIIVCRKRRKVGQGILFKLCVKRAFNFFP